MIGEALLAEDYAASPATAGYLPPVTAEQAWACFDQVGPWLGRARQCQADPAYDLGGELTLPGRFGGWVADDECPPAHLRALCGAATVVAAHLHTLLGALLSAGTPRGFGAARVELERAAGRGPAAAGLPRRALGRPGRPGARSWPSGCWTSPGRVLDELFVLGQLVAAPRPARADGGGGPAAGPGPAADAGGAGLRPLVPDRARRTGTGSAASPGPGGRSTGCGSWTPTRPAR